ncbi:uncharacterized protein LOC126633926 [Malus sylvestris]|uniref:uncharacterized protein LOC126633926 n=1 Tax=Malus sylvestris TaxID=3752 RepID=UPI0021AD396C|nr:uncharacterized protein LOC126633926 [Malus sylvestris]
MTFLVAFVYMEAKKEDNYTWALTRLKTLLHGYCLPGVIATDRDLALLTSIKLEKERVIVVSCGCTICQTHKLSCTHEIAEYRRLGKPVPLDALHPHWRKLDFINVPNSSEQLVPPEKSRVEDLICAFKITEAELAQSESGFDCQTPVTSTMANVSTVSRRKKKQKENFIAPSNKKQKENVITLPKKKQKMNFAATSPIVNADIVLDQLSYDIQTLETNILPQRKQFKIYREEFPEAIMTYITGQTDVNPDENCGYKVISMTLGIDNGWRSYRYAKIERALDYFEDGFAPEYSWLTMPDMGHIIATCYNVVLMHLSMTQCITFLPYSLESSTQSSDTDLREVAIGYLIEDHHFIQV